MPRYTFKKTTRVKLLKLAEKLKVAHEAKDTAEANRLMEAIEEVLDADFWLP